MFTGFSITNKGQQYITKAIEGKKLILTKGQYGDGELPASTPITTMTALISPLAEMPISKRASLENCVITTTQFSNLVSGQLLSPFYFMEAGLFGKVMNEDGTDDEDCPEALLMYANAQSREKADYIPAILTEFILNWPLTISATENVTVEINRSLVYPTMEEFDKRAPLRLIAEGTDDELVATSDTELMNELQIILSLPNGMGAYASLTYNGKEYPIKNGNGTFTTEGQQTAGSAVNVMFNEEEECWYIIGGGSVEIATETEAKEGTNNSKMMTPLRTKQYVDKVLGDVNTILDSINGEVV